MQQYNIDKGEWPIRGIILEDSHGNRRTVPGGKKVKPPRKPDERIVGSEPSPGAYHVEPIVFKNCSHCGEKGVFEYT